MVNLPENYKSVLRKLVMDTDVQTKKVVPGTGKQKNNMV